MVLFGAFGRWSSSERGVLCIEVCEEEMGRVDVVGFEVMRMAMVNTWYFFMFCILCCAFFVWSLVLRKGVGISLILLVFILSVFEFSIASYIITTYQMNSND